MADGGCTNWYKTQFIIIYIMSTDDIFFEDSNPYQHLESYKEYCWQNSIDTYLQTFNTPHSYNHPTYPNQASKQSALVEHEYNLVFTQMSFDLYSKPTLQHQGQMYGGSGQPCYEQQQRSGRVAKPRERKGRCSNRKQQTYNTADYIIKQCFKCLLSQEYAQQVSAYCEQDSVSYEHLVAFLRKGILRNKNKHIGINQLYQFVLQKGVFVGISKKFLVKYLWSDYPHYVLTGNMQNKKEYLECATKLMYISRISSHPGHEIKHIENAQNTEHEK